MTHEELLVLRVLLGVLCGGCIGYGLVGLYLQWRDRR